MDIIKFNVGYIEHRMYINCILANHINNCINNCLYNFEWYGHTIEISSEVYINKTYISVHIPQTIYHIIDGRQLQIELKKLLDLPFKINLLNDKITLKF